MQEAGVRPGFGPSVLVCPGGRKSEDRVGVFHWQWRRSSSVPDSAGRCRCLSWQVPRPGIGLAGLQKPLLRVAVMKGSPGAESHAFANTFSLLDSDLANCCWEKDALIALAPWVHQMLVLARQAHKLAAVLANLAQCV